MNSELSASKYKAYYDLKSQKRAFKPGDEVLVLLPDSANKLLMAYLGPYKVLERRNDVNYVIDVDGKERMYHVNLLKRYFRREVNDIAEECNQVISRGFMVHSVVPVEVNKIDEDMGLQVTLDVDSSEGKPEICNDLTADQKDELSNLLTEFKSVFSEKPGCTSLLEHDIEVNTTERVKSKLYSVPIHLQDVFRKEVETLLEQGII